MTYRVCVSSEDGGEYCGILDDIIELVYTGPKKKYKTIFFKCSWMDCGRGMNIHEQYKLVEVNHTKKYPTRSVVDAPVDLEFLQAPSPQLHATLCPPNDIPDYVQDDDDEEDDDDFVISSDENDESSINSSDSDEDDDIDVIMVGSKDTGKRRMHIDSSDDDIEDAQNLDNTQEPTSSSSRGQTQERS
ncbi:nucleolar transcription factor 1-B-like [Chenopodium quinoa]|uniref:nucleolar transcription factor 1-B-like n=1 Tax=Chenopodium quinoa TaxID=63459 RepID=UPI000B77DD26|nr:nucleolar transcription factor 1-B-like [Chenopodium quinoa]